MGNRFCPDCGAEYRPGFGRCSDCVVPLVDEPPLPPPIEEPPEPSPVVEVASFGRGTDAEMARGYLEANGIDAYVQPLGLSRWRLESALSEVTGVPSAFNSYRLMVFEPEALEAARLLDAADATTPDPEDEPERTGALGRLGTRWLVVVILGGMLLMYALGFLAQMSGAVRLLQDIL